MLYRLICFQLDSPSHPHPRVYRRSADRARRPVDTHRCTTVHSRRWSREVVHVECALVPYYWCIREDIHSCNRGWHCPLVNGELNRRTTVDRGGWNEWQSRRCSAMSSWRGTLANSKWSRLNGPNRSTMGLDTIGDGFRDIIRYIFQRIWSQVERRGRRSCKKATFDEIELI